MAERSVLYKVPKYRVRCISGHKWIPVSHSRSTEPKMALKETVFIMFFILSPIVADLGGELQKEIDNIKQVINKQVLKALDDLSTKAGKCIGTRIIVITT